MLRSFLAALPAVLVVAPLRAGPLEDAIVAAMRLSAEPNYSWRTTVTDDARTYDIAGQTTRGGFTHVQMPVVNSIRRQLGRSVTDTQIELIFLGNVDCVLATDTGWRRVDALAKPGDASATEISGGIGPAGSPGGGGLPGIRGPRRPQSPQPYSNLQLAISHPHEELAVMVSSHREFAIVENVVTGTLTELGAKLLLVHEGQKELTPLRAAGTFKLWLHDGCVAKYELRLEGVLEIETPKGRRAIEVHQSSETFLRDVGTTRFDVPDSARALLARGRSPG